MPPPLNESFQKLRLKGIFDEESDIDLFIFGDDAEFQKESYEAKLHHEIQVFAYQTKNEVKRKLDPAVIPNIVKGFLITENLEPFEVAVHE